jgi:hypothetical protein
MPSHADSHSRHEEGHSPLGLIAIYQVIYRWACLDLNQGPLPYQGVGSAALIAGFGPVTWC